MTTVTTKPIGKIMACVHACCLVAGLMHAADISIVENGAAMATIIVPDNPLPIPLSITDKSTRPWKRVGLTQQYAAEELQRWIKKASMVTLPIVKASTTPASGTLVLVGQSSISLKAGLKPPTAPEGLAITTFDRGIAILGEIAPKGTNNVNHEIDRGVLHGVYEFLERVVGYRWYFVDNKDPELGIVVPDVKSIRIPAAFHLLTAPDFPHRKGGVISPWRNQSAYYPVMRPGAATGFFANHTDQQWGRMFRKQHPQEFILHKDGSRDLLRPCYSSPETLAQRIKLYRDHFSGRIGLRGRQKPNEKYAPFVIIDNYHIPCQCKLCMQHWNPNAGRYGRISEIIFRHTNAFARGIAKLKPGMRISTLAYSHYMLPPKIAIERNVDIMVATMWSTQLNKEEYWYKRNLALMKQWSSKVEGRRERLFAWTYACWPGGPAPRLFPHSQQRWLRDLHKIFSGEFVNPSQPTVIGHYLNHVWFRLLWNRNLDIEADLHDYCTRFFGPAATPMEKFYQLCIERWENTKWSMVLPTWYVPSELMYGETYTSEVMAALQAHITRAKAACVDNPKNIYTRRMAWMEKGLAPFFKRAHYCHKWLKSRLSYRVSAATRSPEKDTDWTAIPAISLVRGRLGEDPEYITRMQILRHENWIHVRFQASDKTKPRGDDRLILEFRNARLLSLPIILAKDQVELERKFPQGIYQAPPDKRQYLEILPNGTGLGNLDAAMVSNEYRNNTWTVHMRFPASLLKLNDGRSHAFAAQVRRVRAPRRGEDSGSGKQEKSIKPKPRKYVWMPQLDPTDWPEISRRYGKILFPAVH